MEGGWLTQRSRVVRQRERRVHAGLLSFGPSGAGDSGEAGSFVAGRRSRWRTNKKQDCDYPRLGFVVSHPSSKERSMDGARFYLQWVGFAGAGLIRNKTGFADGWPLWSPTHRAKNARWMGHGEFAVGCTSSGLGLESGFVLSPPKTQRARFGWGTLFLCAIETGGLRFELWMDRSSVDIPGESRYSKHANAFVCQAVLPCAHRLAER